MIINHSFEVLCAHTAAMSPSEIPTARIWSALSHAVIIESQGTLILSRHLLRMDSLTLRMSYVSLSSRQRVMNVARGARNTRSLII